jgi:general secretion pathway protein I
VKGFTLLEVMIALAITAGVLLTAITTLNHHLSLVDQDAAETTAALLGRAKMSDPDFDKTTDNSGDFAPDHPAYKWRREVTPVADLPGVNQIALTVSWDEDKKNLQLVKYALSVPQ